MADIHLRTFRLHDEYEEIFKRLIVDINSLVNGYDRDEIRIVIAGDIVHQKIVISNEQIMLCAWLFRELEKIAPLIIIAGNHDLLENNKDRLDSITPIVRLLPDLNINYFKESKCYKDDNIVWCVYSIFEENKRPNIESAKAQFGDDLMYFGLYHAALKNAKTDIGYSVDHGDGLEIFEGLNGVLLGDIHKHQVFIHKDIPIIYPSSLIQQNFGESIKNHGFVVWDVETLKYELHEVENASPFYQFSIKSLEDLDNGTEILVNL